MSKKNLLINALLCSIFLIAFIIAGCTGPVQHATEQDVNQQSGKPSTNQQDDNQNSENTPEGTLYVISGYVYDASFPYGKNVGIANTSIAYENNTVYSDATGKFTIKTADEDPLLTIKAPNYHIYRERPSRMVNGGFHLIPEDIYRGVYLVLWNKESSNPNNSLRKWEKQTQFVIVKALATDAQVNKILNLLAADEYRKMTGGRFTSSGPVKVVDKAAMVGELEGKTVISFAPGIVQGGIAHSEAQNGIIYCAKVTYNTSQKIDKAVLWHEMGHTVTAGGHINEWPSVVSEVKTTGYVTKEDEKIFNCIYNSPPNRNSDFQ